MRAGSLSVHGWCSKILAWLWKTAWQFLKTLNTELPDDPAISVLSICSEELKTGTQINTCTHTFIAALFKIASRWKCPSMDEWIKNCGIYIQ